MDILYQNDQPVAASSRTTFFSVLQKIFLLFIIVPLLQLQSAQAQAPHITSFHPTSAKQWDTVSIYGTHLDSVKAVSFGGVPAEFFTILSDSLIWAIVGPGASGKVKVSSRLGVDSLSGFTYIIPPPPSIPHISSFIPDSARQNDTVLIRGVRFTGVNAVSFGGVPAQSFHVLSDSAISAVVATGASGIVQVTHSFYSGSLAGFIFIAPPPLAPHLTSFIPHSAGHWDTVSLRGTHLSNVTSVTFGGVPAQSFTILSDSLIWAIVGTGATGKVKVFTAQASDSLPGFTFIIKSSPIPHILYFSPDSARRGDTVAIKGFHFTGATAVSFGGVTAGSFTILSDSLIRAAVGTGSTGYVKVANSSYSDSLGGFIFISSDTTPPPPPPPPTGLHILSFSPDSARQGDSVTISGHHFDSVVTVSFGGVPARSFTIFSDSLIQAIVGTGASGNVKVATALASDSLGGFIFISSDTTPPPPPPPPASFELTSFTGTPVAGHAQLNWNVLHEESIFFYSVEQSTDTISSHFASIGGVASLKLDSASYTFTDTASRTGINYYRLRIIDTTGNTSFSGTIAIDLASVPGTISLYPNPAVGHIFVQVPVTTLSSKFVLADAAGQVVLTVPVRAGVQQMIIPIGQFNKGVYKLVWTNGQSSAIRTVLILK